MPRRTPRAAEPSDDRPRRVPLSHRRALVAGQTRLRPVRGVESIRLHLADDVAPVWRAIEAETGASGPPIPFWAFAWAGGLALSRYVIDHPAEVAGRRVLDFATGSGLVAIAAAMAGATEVRAADIDPFAEAAVAMNARANGVRIDFIGRDLLDEPPPAVEILLAADTWYEGPFAERVLPWLVAAAERGTRVLIADPGRRYLPADRLSPIASYEVETTTQLEDRAVLRSRVFEIRDAGQVAVGES